MLSAKVGSSNLRIGLFRNSKIFKSSLLKYSTSTETSKKDVPKNPEQAKKEAAELAMQSIKDLGGLFSSSSSDDATQPIETKPVFQNPKLFGTLSLLHQGQVLKELQAKFDQKWTKLTLEDKKLGYYIYYGDWGVREKFDNWKTNKPPYDLPFHVPSKVRTTSPTKTTKIKRLDSVILAETPVRKEQFDFKRVDGVSKFFIYLTLFISMFAIYRDKNYGEEFKPTEVIIEDEHEKARQEKQKLLEKELLTKITNDEKKLLRKWYYLWLK